MLVTVSFYALGLTCILTHTCISFLLVLRTYFHKEESLTSFLNTRVPVFVLTAPHGVPQVAGCLSSNFRDSLLTCWKRGNSPLEMAKEVQIRENKHSVGITADAPPSLWDFFRADHIFKLSGSFKTIISLFPGKLEIHFHITDIEISNISMPTEKPNV